ncbi:MAG: autotransporter-associated beta strand repeat-containing protein, partial [Thermoguttaceae bacterium]|nr:autotransporter-associated beta strand repeat-containing protein [Thermoguttaceae bacterium]
DGNKQYFKNLVGSGDLEILEDTDVISSYDEGEYEFSGKIYGNGDFEKKGKGALTLSGANSISGTITISDGKIRLIEDAIAASERIEGRSKGKVEYYVADDVTETLYIPNDSKHVQVKSIEKTGNGDLQIYVGATGCVSAESFVISSGRVDYGGYFQSIAPEGQELGTFDVNGGNTFSPGLTVDEHGETINTVGRFEITNEVSLNIKENALALFEFDVYSEELYLNNEELFLQTFDRIVFQHEDSTFVAADSTIDLAFLSGDVSDWAKEGNEYWIVNDHGFKDKEGNPIPEGESVNFDNLLRNTYKDYFSLEGRYNGLYLVGKGAPVLLVPEPSSWALMIGTLLTFLFLKKKRG